MDAVVLNEVKNLNKTMGVSKVKDKFALSFGDNLINFDGYTDIHSGTFKESSTGTSVIADISMQTLIRHYNLVGYQGLVEFEDKLYCCSNANGAYSHLIKLDKFTGNVISYQVAIRSSIRSAPYLQVDALNRKVYGVTNGYGSNGGTAWFKYDIDSDTIDYWGSSGNLKNGYALDVENEMLYCVSGTTQLFKINLKTKGTETVNISRGSQNNTKYLAGIYLKEGVLKALVLEPNYNYYSLVNLEDNNLTNKTLSGLETVTKFYSNQGTLKVDENNGIYLNGVTGGNVTTMLKFNTEIEAFEEMGVFPQGEYIYESYLDEGVKRIGAKLALWLSASLQLFDPVTETFDADPIYRSSNYLKSGGVAAGRGFVVDLEKNLLYFISGVNYLVLNLDYENGLYSLETRGETMAIMEADFNYPPGATSVTTHFLYLVVDGITIKRKMIPDKPLVVVAKHGLTVQNDRDVILTWGVK